MASEMHGPSDGLSPPEFDTKLRKLLIYIGRASNLPLQQGQLSVLGRFSDVQSLQHFGLSVVDG
jgi:hypothetical protein